MFTENANRIFNRSIEEYHRWDDVDHPIDNPYAPGTIDHLLYHKNWIDTVQWHLEDIIRDPAIDRLSILALKIYHMAREAERTDVDDAHRAACRKKLDVLLAQQVDLSQAIEELIEDIEAGRKYMKTYKQMKMYNDPALNPVLYGQKK